MLKMKRYIIEAKDDIYDYDNYDEFDKEYDRLFGEPTTEVFEVNEFFRYMDELIEYSKHSVSAASNSSASSEPKEFQIKDIIATAVFEHALKKQVKKHKTDILNQILEVVEKLLNYDIEREYKNHNLHYNLSGHKDIHIEGGNLVLIYKYVSPEKIRIDAKFDSDADDVLKLQDLVDHKDIQPYDSKKLKSPMRHLTYDELKEKMKLK